MTTTSSPSLRSPRSRIAAALLVVSLAGLAACDTSSAPTLPAPVSVPSAVPGAPEDDDDGTVAPPPAGQQEDDDDRDDGPDDDN